jgi:hypothetical protein
MIAQEPLHDPAEFFLFVGEAETQRPRPRLFWFSLPPIHQYRHRPRRQSGAPRSPRALARDYSRRTGRRAGNDKATIAGTEEDDVTDNANIQRQISDLSPFGAENIQWKRLQGGDSFDYPIDYWIAVLGTQPEAGRADFLVKWEPDSYCHFHKHTGASTVMVLEGEHHIVEEGATETVHKTRRPGHLTRSPAGDVHMEYAGPQGSVLFFSMQADDGVLFELLARDGGILRLVTVEDLATGNY